MLNKNQYGRVLFILLCLGVVVVGCANYSSCAGDKREVTPEDVTIKIYNWESYLAPDTLAEFTRRTGIKTELSIFPDLDVMLSRIQSDPGEFDVIFPSRYRLCRLLELKLLQPLDLAQMTNRRHIDPDTLSLFCDEEGRYFVPYLMGTTGIAYNREVFPDGVDSWNELFNPEWKGRVSLLNNADEVLTIGLKLMGQSLNTNDPNKIRKAGRLLKKSIGNVRGFMDPIRTRNLLLAGETVIAHAYSGEIVFASRQNSMLQYAIPQEGCAKWVDLMAIPAEARHPAEANRFINYMLDPQVNADCAAYLGYGTPNQSARALLPADLLNHPAINPAPEQLARCEFFGDMESSRAARNRAWESLKRR